MFGGPAPHAYATPADDGAIATASRLKPAGVLGSVTAAQLVPPFVERHTPSLHAPRISALAPPPGAMVIAHVRAARRCVHVTPPLVETYRPPVVPASMCC